MRQTHAAAFLAALSASSLAAQDAPWYERMDYGPVLAQTFSSASRPSNTALKGLAIRLGDAENPAGLLFDTELLRVACAWDGGYLSLRGTPFDGSHGPHSRTGGESWFDTDPVPGWSLDGSFEDPRALPGHGPLPRALAKYRGLHLAGEMVVLEYDVAGSRVLESPTMEACGGERVVVRSFVLAPSAKARTLLLADGMPNGGFAVEPRSILIEKVAPKPELVTSARTNGAWSSLAFGAPRTDADDNPALAGSVSAFLAEARQTKAQVVVRSLPRATAVHRIHTYASGNTAVQRYTAYGSADEAPQADPGKWVKLAEVDTNRLGNGGKQGVAIARPDGQPLGTFRHLLFVPRTQDKRTAPLAFEAVCALGADHGVRNVERLSQMFVLSEGAPAGTEMLLRDGRALVHMPAHAAAARFDVRIWHGDRARLDPVYEAARTAAPARDLEAALAGGPVRWRDTITLAGQRSSDTQAYVVDTIPVPFDNPYASWMRTAAFDFFPDGTTAAVSTWNGDVWLVSGINESLEKVTWKRFATGLFDPLGLRIVDGIVHTLGRDQITRLHDVNGDGEADWYECFNNDVLITEGFHEFAFDLHTDPDGNFYFAKAGPVNPGGRGFQKLVPHHGCILKVSKDGEKIEVYATGFRAPNGMGVGPQGQVTSGDNEGTWMPKCRLSWVQPGSFNGCVDLAQRDVRPSTYDRPLCWFPHDVDNSSGGQVWVTSDKWGPMQGELLHLSYGTCSVFKVMKEEVAGLMQGGVVRLPLSFASSCMRARFNPVDGQLYVCGFKGWQTSAAQDGGLSRVRYTGKPLYLPMELRSTPTGVAITFSVPVDKEVAEDPQSYDVQVWNYIWGEQYGSPHISVADPEADMKKMGGKIDIGYRNSDKLSVTAAKLSADGKTVNLTIAGIQPVMQMQIKLNVDAADGESIKQTIWNTLHNLGK